MFTSKIGAAVVAVGAALLISVGPALAAGGWTIVAAPPTGQDAQLNGVATTSDANAWAVGYCCAAPTTHGASIVQAVGYSGLSQAFNPLAMRNG